ncbi:unnamed protein product [Prorocentrum cordatum]|uniref:Cyclic nucleotide-binding domain-containing protein n=1 Tax=Prorocentrum cordatum TaxID=2364126 RepID=A0ABN9WEV9_9DINO|nr:unnamed protein product [Polarella glacialis]
MAQGKRRKIDTLGQGGVGNTLLLQGVEFASKVPLFSTLAPSELPLVAGAFSVVEYKEDEVIIKQGDPGRELFIIESGRVAVNVQWPWLEDPVRVQELEEGSYFGEEALLSGAPRSASLVALEDCKLWVLERSDFENLGLRHRLHFRKKQAVHMGSTDEENEHADYHEDKQEKTDAQRELLRAAFMKHENVGPLLAYLSEADVDAVVESARPLEVESGMEIMTQGDTKMVLFYIVEEGAFEVFRDGKSISMLGRGQSFGELALLVLEPCAATVRATTASKLWAIPRQTLREVRKAPLRQRVEEYVKVLGKTQQLQDACREKLAEVLTEMTFSKDEYIIRQGEEVRSFFVLYDGRVSMYVDGQQGSSRELCGDPNSGATEFFGERALVGDETSPASVRCVSDRVVVLALERQDFLRVMRRCQPSFLPAEATTASADTKGKLKGNLMEYSLDRLQEVALLGCGSYARVSLQRDRETGRFFALKALSKGRILQRRQVRQVQTERLVLKTTNSPFLIRLAATCSRPRAMEAFGAVQYHVPGAPLLHERLVLVEPGAGTTISVLSPDGGNYEEGWIQGPDIAWFGLMAGGACGVQALAGPRGLAVPVYRLRNVPTPARRGGRRGRCPGCRPSSGTCAGGRASSAAPPPPAIGVGGVLVPVRGALIVAAPGGAHVPTVDIRAQSLSHDASGARFREFRHVFVGVAETSANDLLVRGPRTTLRLCRFMAANGQTPLGRHARWKAEAKLQNDDGGVENHLMCCQMLESMATLDQLNLPDIAGESSSIVTGPTTGGRIRVIFDARACNYSFKDPLSARLPTALSPNQVEIDGPAFVATGGIYAELYRPGLLWRLRAGGGPPTCQASSRRSDPLDPRCPSVTSGFQWASVLENIAAGPGAVSLCQRALLSCPMHCQMMQLTWGTVAELDTMAAPRLPLPRLAALAIAGGVIVIGLPRMAAVAAVSHACYLRRVEGFDCELCREAFAAVAEGLGLGPLDPRPYQLRRGGASEDLASQRRTPEQVMRRGRWATAATSLKRCGKETKLSRVISQISHSVFSIGSEMPQDFSRALRSGVGARRGQLPMLVLLETGVRREAAGVPVDLPSQVPALRPG